MRSANINTGMNASRKKQVRQITLHKKIYLRPYFFMFCEKQSNKTILVQKKLESLNLGDRYKPSHHKLF